MTKSQRAQEVCQKIQTLTVDLVTIQEELQDWQDNLPENMRDGDRAEAIEDAMNCLEQYVHDITCACEEIENMDWPQ